MLVLSAGGRPRNCSSEGRSRRSPRADPAPDPDPDNGPDGDVLSPLARSSSLSPPPSPAPLEQAEAAGQIANNADMRQSVDERQLSTKMVGRKDALEVSSQSGAPLHRRRRAIAFYPAGLPQDLEVWVMSGKSPIKMKTAGKKQIFLLLCDRERLLLTG